MSGQLFSDSNAGSIPSKTDTHHRTVPIGGTRPFFTHKAATVVLDIESFGFDSDSSFSRTKPIWKPETNKKYLISPVWYPHLAAALAAEDATACKVYAKSILEKTWKGEGCFPRFYPCFRYYSESERGYIRVKRADVEAHSALTKLSKLEIARSEKGQNKRPWDLDSGSYVVTAIVVWDEQSMQSEKKFRTPDSVAEVLPLTYTLSLKNYKAFKDHHQRQDMNTQDPEVQITNGEFKKPSFVAPKHPNGNNLLLMLTGKGPFGNFDPPCTKEFLMRIDSVVSQIPDIAGKEVGAKDIEEIIASLTKTSVSGGGSRPNKAAEPDAAAVASADQMISNLLDD